MRFLLGTLALASFLSLAWLQAATAEDLTHTKDTLDTVKKNIKEGKAQLLDVREQKEWAEGHLEGAVLMPKSKLDVEKEAIVLMMPSALSPLWLSFPEPGMLSITTRWRRGASSPIRATSFFTEKL